MLLEVQLLAELVDPRVRLLEHLLDLRLVGVLDGGELHLLVVVLAVERVDHLRQLRDLLAHLVDDLLRLERGLLGVECRPVGVGGGRHSWGRSRLWLGVRK